MLPLGLHLANHIFMDKITPNQYIRLQKKLCTPALIVTAHNLATQWGLTPAEACYRLLTDALMREYEKRKKENYSE